MKIACPRPSWCPALANASSILEDTSSIAAIAELVLSVVVSTDIASIRRHRHAGMIPEHDLARDLVQRHHLVDRTVRDRFLGHAEHHAAFLILCARGRAKLAHLEHAAGSVV